MDIPTLLALYDQEMRIDVHFPEARKDVFPGLIRFIRPAPGMNFINYSRLDEATADQMIQQQVEDLRPLNQPFEWIVFDHDLPADLPQRLEAHGFATDEHEPVLVLDLEEAARSQTAQRLFQPVSADVRPITTRDALKDIIAVESQVWGGDFNWIYNRLGLHLETPGYLDAYVAYVDGQPACTGWTYLHAGTHFGGLWGGSTVESYRGRGLYTAVLATRVQEAARRGYRYLTIIASPMSLPIVSKYGFTLLDYTASYGWQKPEDE